MRWNRVMVAWLLGALAFGGVFHVSRAPAPGLDPDAMSYVGAGESLARTGRLRIPAADWWETTLPGSVTRQTRVSNVR